MWFMNRSDRRRQSHKILCSFATFNYEQRILSDLANESGLWWTANFMTKTSRADRGGQKQSRCGKCTQKCSIFVRDLLLPKKLWRYSETIHFHWHTIFSSENRRDCWLQRNYYSIVINAVAAAWHSGYNGMIITEWHANVRFNSLSVLNAIKWSCMIQLCHCT